MEYKNTKVINDGLYRDYTSLNPCSNGIQNYKL